MLKLFLLAIILATLTTLAACSGPTPAPEAPAYTPAPTPTAAPESTAPVSTETPTERSTAAPKATPTSTPTPKPTASPALPGVLAPLQALDSGEMFSELSDAEKECIGENPERQTRFFGCLEDETVARIFLAGFVSGPEPLSQESSDCVRAGFEVIDPKAVMTSGIEGDPGRAMAGSMAALSVTIACLNDEEWEETAPILGMSPDERAGMQCLMEALGGPGQMAAAMTAAQEGDFTNLAQAGTHCGLDMGPEPGQAPARTPPAPTATGEAPTPASTPVTTGATPSGTPVTTGATPSGTPAITGATPSGTPAITGATPTGTPVTTGPTPSGTPVATGATPSGTPAITGATPSGTPGTPTP